MPKPGALWSSATGRRRTRSSPLSSRRRRLSPPRPQHSSRVPVGWTSIVSACRVCARGATRPSSPRRSSACLAPSPCSWHTPPTNAGGAELAWLFGTVLQDAGNNLVKGGMHHVSLALADHLRSLGGEIRTNAGVEKILVRSGRATGVRLEDGEEIPVGRLVASGGELERLRGRPEQGARGQTLEVVRRARRALQDQGRRHRADPGARLVRDEGEVR